MNQWANYGQERIFGQVFKAWLACQTRKLVKSSVHVIVSGMYKVLAMKIDALLDILTPSQRGGMTGYLIAAGLVLVALLGRLEIAPAEAGVPFLTFFPAVTLAVVLGGIGPGLFAMVICTILASYMFIPPFYAFPFTFHPDVIWSNFVFCAEELIVILVVEAMYRQRSNYITTVDLLEQIEMAKQELQICATAFETQEGMFITDADGVILRVNFAFTDITGYTSEEAIGKNPRLLSSGRHDAAFYAAMWESIHSTGNWKGEVWNRRKNGEIYPERLTVTAVKDMEGIVTNYVATLTDITMSNAAVDLIKNLAFYDPLTRLPNRRLLVDRVRQALASSARSGREGALLFLDLDHFKRLNDTLGHDVGDLLLQQVAERLTSCVREGDTVARLGGDEFVVLLEDLSEQDFETAAHAESIGEKILSTLNQPYQLGTHVYHSTSSIGATLINSHQSGTEELLQQADIAMYQAKKAGRNALRFFDPQMQDAINARASLEGELRKALDKQQFHLYYQIQVDSSGRPLGAEALIRWIHPERG
ncbi:MAG: putative bifunctional diguanylate cyclase/phosphodiesterase, partial [Methylotenera sp.]